MATKSSIIFPSFADSVESPAKRHRRMNTPPDEADESEQVNNLLDWFAATKADRWSGNDGALIASWERLLCQIQDEVRTTAQTQPNIVPVIDYKDISVTVKADVFLRGLKTRGAAIIRNVIPADKAAAWSYELDSYLRDNPHTKASPPENPELYELFWSLAQLNARAHPNMLAAQSFTMRGCWHHSSSGASRENVSCNFPVTYGDRARMPHKSFRGSSSRLCEMTPPEPGDGDAQSEGDCCSGHSATATHRKIWSGDWEHYDPWDSSTRLDRTAESSNDSSTSSVFRMFLGVLPLSVGSRDDDSPMRVCSLPLKLTTAYRLLRPFFSPKRPLIGSKEAFLDPSNWFLDTAAHHAGQSFPPQEINDALHPHLQLEKTLISLPPLNPGDYMIWHPDTIHASPSPRRVVPNTASLSPSYPPPSPSTLLYIPACPLTQTNATYLAHQRKAFLLGLPGPDFTTGGRAEIGESYHMGRPGVQDIHDAGGEEALRAMGLLAWDEDDAVDGCERELLRVANAVLFPDRAGGR